MFNPFKKSSQGGQSQPQFEQMSVNPLAVGNENILEARQAVLARQQKKKDIAWAQQKADFTEEQRLKKMAQMREFQSKLPPPPNTPHPDDIVPDRPNWSKPKKAQTLHLEHGGGQTFKQNLVESSGDIDNLMDEVVSEAHKDLTGEVSKSNSNTSISLGF